MNDPFTRLVAVVVMTVPVVFWIWCVMHWIAEGELEATPGIISIFVAAGCVPLAGTSHSLVVPYAACLIIFATLISFPFARAQMGGRMHREIDTHELERAHEAFAKSPDNVHARFEIARVLHKMGLHGHAIAIADLAGRSLGTEVDQATNRSYKDLFHTELYRLEGWKRDLQDPTAFRPVKCPRCQRPNQPGTIVCESCGGPFLLDVARGALAGEKMLTRLVLSWVVVAAVILLSCVASTTVPGTGMFLVVISLACAGALGVYAINRPKRLA